MNTITLRRGQPEHVQWLARGQPATRAQVLASIESGLPLLKKAAEEEGPKAERTLKQNLHRIETRRKDKPGPPGKGRCEWCREETGTYTILDMDVQDYRAALGNG